MRTSRTRKLTSISIALVFVPALAMSSADTWAQNAPAAQTAPAAASPAEQVPQPNEGGVNWSGVGYGAGALFGNLLYFPAKLTYALLGSLFGGGAWLLTGGNTQTANTIWRSSLGGDYVLTPQMIAGEQPINFSGPTETSPVPQEASTTPENAPPPPASMSSGQPAPASGPAEPPAAPPPTASTPGAQPMDTGTGPVPQAASSPVPPNSIE